MRDERIDGGALERMAVKAIKGEDHTIVDALENGTALKPSHEKGGVTAVPGCRRCSCSETALATDAEAAEAAEPVPTRTAPDPTHRYTKRGSILYTGKDALVATEEAAGAGPVWRNTGKANAGGCCTCAALHP
jgi:hypothetical protein